MVTINTFDDLVRALDENPGWAEALRTRVLTKELLELPEAFTQFASQTNQRLDRLETAVAQLAESQADLIRRVDRLETAIAQLAESQADIIRRVDRLETAIAQLTETVAETSQQVAQLTAAMAASDQRARQMETDIGRMKGHDARNAVQADGGRRVARSMNLRRTRLVDVDEIWDLTLDNDTGDIRAGDIQSFRDADVIMVAADEDGQEHYVAVEVSYSVNGRDAERAIRNAQLLRRFTGQSAYAAVAGTRANNRVREMIEDGSVHWYRILDKDIEPN